MKSLTLLIALSISLAGCSPADQPTTESNTATKNTISADTVYTNGKIYTVNKAQPWAEALAIKDGKILVIGSADEIAEVTGDSTRVIDLGGQFVMPGLVDTHTHPFDGALSQLNELVFDPIPTNLEDIQQQVSAYVESHPEHSAWRGGDIPKGIFAGENYMREDLDAVVSDRPFCIIDQGGHALWCNTFALEATGIMDPDFEVGEYDVIERDENGIPSGTIREMTVGKVNRLFLKVSEEMNIEAAKYVMELFNRKGVTALRTANGNQDHASALKALADNGEITTHWAMSYDVNFLSSVYTHEENMAQIAERHQYASEFVATDFAKIFIDSDINGYGIAMLEPFPGTDGNYGSTVITAEKLNRLTQQLDKEGVSIQYHAFGSRSTQMIADALELAAEANGGTLNARHYPDHNGFPQESLDRLIAVNGGVIGFAPSFAFTFPGIHESYIEFLGAEKIRTMQPLRTALDKGAIIGVGTDYAALPQDPWPLLEGVIHRRNPWVGPNDSEPNGPEEAITLEESIYAYTLGGAHALLKEDSIGSLEKGKYADFIVLDRNLTEIPVDDISETQVLKTVFNGKVVYEAAQ